MSIITRNELEDCTVLTQTCLACPSQWEGVLKDGRCFYVRYRHGRLTIHIGKSISEAITSPPAIKRVIGDRLDGYIEWNDVLRNVPS